MKIFQKGFNYSQDGPGNRLVYHLKGCNFRCLWCSNPEGLEPEGGIIYTPDEMVREILRARPMFFDGGGVTFTGGECTLQFDELLYVLKNVRKEGINTAIETNGSHVRLPELSLYVDCLMMDVKHVDPGIHKEQTGADVANTLNNYKILAKTGPLHVRIPLIKHFNSEDGERFGDFFEKYGTDDCD